MATAIIFLFPYPTADEPHPAVIVSNNGICSNPALEYVNALPCQTVRPADRDAKANEVYPQNSLKHRLGRIRSRRSNPFDSSLRFLSLLLFSSQEGTKITKNKGIGLAIVSA